jgi:superfamily II DNA or RNA helicase
MSVPGFDAHRAEEDAILKAMIRSIPRNQFIIEDLIRAVKDGRKIIVFSERRMHLDLLRQIFVKSRPNGSTDGFLRGGMTKEERVLSEKCNVLWATYDFLSEGWDCDAVDTIFLTTPLSNPEQAIGRGSRYAEGKKDSVVFDYVDRGPKWCDSRFEKRKTIYRSLNSILPEDRMGDNGLKKTSNESTRSTTRSTISDAGPLFR